MWRTAKSRRSAQENKVLSPSESSVSVVRIARQVRNEKSKQLIQIFRQRANEPLILERHCLTLQEEVEHSSEGQEVLTVLMESKINMQETVPEKCHEKIFEELKELEEQRTKEVLELVQKKRKLIKCEGERERARILQRLEASRAVGPWSGAHDNSSFGFVLIFVGFRHRRSDVGFLSDWKGCRRSVV